MLNMSFRCGPGVDRVWKFLHSCTPGVSFSWHHTDLWRVSAATAFQSWPERLQTRRTGTASACDTEKDKFIARWTAPCITSSRSAVCNVACFSLAGPSRHGCGETLAARGEKKPLSKKTFACASWQKESRRPDRPGVGGPAGPPK